MAKKNGDWQFPSSVLISLRPRKKGNQPQWVIGGVDNDGGGYIITTDRWFHPHVKRVPPWDPGIKLFSVASDLLDQLEAKATTARVASTTTTRAKRKASRAR
jgi:hypothetical protein